VEVRGTAFRVEAHGRRIAGVSVHEGRVEVRYAGYTAGGAAGHAGDEHPATAPGEARPTVVLAKGEAWVAMHDAPVAAKRETSDPPPSPSAGAVAAPPAKVAAATTPTAPVIAATTTGAGGSATSPPPAGTAFSEGMHLIERGDYAAGAEKLDAYRRANAGDPRAEDAAYLTILALQRAGRREDARAAARRYLSAYPNGYRRAEAERVAR
jgi:TolA-binding protein